MDRLEKGMYWDEALSLVRGCTPAKMSEDLACKNCWLRSMDKRFDKDRGDKVEPWPERLKCVKSKPKVFAVWSDLFHESIPFSYISDCMRVLNENPQHIYLILTKRPERLLEWSKSCKKEFLENQSIWFGTTCETQETSIVRIRYLTETECVNRFLSVEPMLGPIRIDGVLEGGDIDWVICGCESGSKRKTELSWVESLCFQCAENDVPFFLKQLIVDGKLVKLPEVHGRKWCDRPFMKNLGYE